MKKNKKSFIIIVIIIVAIIAASIFLFKKKNYKNSYDLVQKIVSKMNIDEKIGQILMLSFREWGENNSLDDLHNVATINNEIQSIISDYHIGGVVLFFENCTDARQLVNLTYDIQHAAINKGELPLLIATDQEGGKVTRAKFGTAFSGNMALGASGDTNNAYTVGKIIGKEMNALGINCVFAPVADVNSNKKNPIIGVRSFSGVVDVVSNKASAMADGFANSNIINCAKHFPGHGDTSTDSHTGLPVVEKDFDEWIMSDGAPFDAIIKNGNTDMIMTAHIQYPKLDDTKVFSPAAGREIIVPATMSKKILTGILKEKLGFDGVIITDAMDMDAIDKQFGISDATIRAIDAGTDIILMPVIIRCTEDILKLKQLLKDIKEAISDGRLTEECINDAAIRVVRLKLERGIIDKNYNYDLDEAKTNALKIVGCKEHRDVEREIASKCVKMIYNGEFKTFTPTNSDKIVCVMPREGETNSSEHAFIRMKKEGKISDSIVECYNYEKAWNGNEELDNKMLEAVSNADYLILGYFQTVETLSDPMHIRNIVFDKILKYANTDNIAIIWEYLPYETNKYSNDYPCVVIYNSAGMLQEDIGKEMYSGEYGPAIPAGIEAIFGF